MATKKQKREAALAKREKMLAAERKVGLDALERDRQRRDREARQAKADALRRKNAPESKVLNAMFSLDYKERMKG